MAGVKQRTTKKPQVTTAARQLDAYQHDLNPYPMAGQNLGAAGAHPEKGTRTLYDIKDLHHRFSDWSDSDLKQIPVLPEGSRLEQNATYIDLADPEPGDSPRQAEWKRDQITATCQRARSLTKSGTD